MDNKTWKRNVDKLKYWSMVTAFCVSLLIVAIAVGDVQASPPPIPSSFYGTVSINGENVSLDTEVSAWIDGHWIMSVPVTLDNGTTVYAMNIPGDNPSTPEIDGGKHGDEVVFYIGNQRANQTGTWLSGSNQELNLSTPQADGWTLFFPLFFR